MDLTKYQHQESVVVAASPEAVYDLIADVTRIGEFSPVCVGGEWDADDLSWFVGTNQAGDRTWQTRCRVEVAARGREFTFVNHGLDGADELVRWSYTFTPVDGGTEVTESWSVLPDYEAMMARLAPSLNVEEYLDGVVGPTREGMAETLAKLKAVAES